MSTQANRGGTRGVQSRDALGVIRIHGPETHTFLQGQLSNDMRSLTPGGTLLCAFSTPQGRVVAVLRLVESGGDVLAVLPRSMAAAVIERMRRYVLRAKVTLGDAADETTVLRFTSGAAARVRASLSAEDRFVELPGARALVITTASRAGAIESGARTASDNEWHLAQIAAGEPQVYPETTEEFVAQMLNLDLLGAISFSKGCYTGQEVITRTHHLGRIKRRMLRYQAASTVAPIQRGDSISVPGQKAGKVIEWAVRPDGNLELLAVVAETPAGAGVRMAHDQLTRLPLPYEVPGH